MTNISSVSLSDKAIQDSELHLSSSSAGIQRTQNGDASVSGESTSLAARSVDVIGLNDLSDPLLWMLCQFISYKDFLNLGVAEKSLYHRLTKLFYEQQKFVYLSDEFVATEGLDFYFNAFVTHSYFMRQETNPNFKTSPEILERKLAERNHAREALVFTNQIIFENADRSIAGKIEQMILQLAKCFVHRLSLKEPYDCFVEGVEALLSRDTFTGETADLDFAKHCLSFISECQEASRMPHRLGNLPQSREDQMFELYQVFARKIQPQSINALIVDEHDFPEYGYEIENVSQAIPVLRTDLPALPMPGEVLNLVRNEQISFDFLPFQISKLPESFFTLVNVTRLDLAMIGLTVLPGFIGRLVNLQNLDLSYNQLETLPDEIATLPNLWDLNLVRNFFTAFPEAMASMSKLEQVALEERLRSLLPEVLQQQVVFSDLSDLMSDSDSESDSEEDITSSSL